MYLVFLTNQKDYELCNSERFFILEGRDCVGLCLRGAGTKVAWGPANDPRLRHSRAGMRGRARQIRLRPPAVLLLPRPTKWDSAALHKTGLPT